MPGRHDSHARGRDGWAPTAVNAVVACTPATSLFTALGLAGGGYLAGREDFAACGAVVGAFGLVVERFQTRGLRRRLRRERARFRDDLRGVGCELAEVHRALASLREDLDGVRAERDGVRDQLRATMRELTEGRHEQARTPALPVIPAAPRVGAAPVVPAGPAEPFELFRPVVDPAPAAPVQPVQVEAGPAVSAAADTAPVPRAARVPFVPGQLRSPIATGGIPLLPPGPSEPVRVVDLRSSAPSTGPVLQAAAPSGPATGTGRDTGPVTMPIPRPGALPADAVDALVYAAIDEAEADELTRVLKRGGGRHAGLLHAGDAHHAGDYAREDGAPHTAVLYVVNRGRHVA